MEELPILIQRFRGEAEDLIKAVVLQFYFNNIDTAAPFQPYADVNEAYAVIGSKWWPFMTVNIAGSEYWFMPNGNLVPKVGNLALEDGSVTLEKMANVPSITVFYRKSAGDGPPEVQTLATLKADLGIDDILAFLQNLVEKEPGKSLVADWLIELIHPAGTDIQDLSHLVEKREGYRLISEEEAALIKQVVFTITLPASSSVAGRCSGVIEGTDYPEGWIISEYVNPVDLIITHNLDRRIAQVTVFSVDGTEERQLFANAAYAGIVAPDKNTLIIEGLATINSDIVIHLIFS